MHSKIKFTNLHSYLSKLHLLVIIHAMEKICMCYFSLPPCCQIERRLIQEGRLRPVVAKMYPGLSSVAAAQDELELGTGEELL